MIKKIALAATLSLVGGFFVADASADESTDDTYCTFINASWDVKKADGVVHVSKTSESCATGERTVTVIRNFVPNPRPRPFLR